MPFNYLILNHRSILMIHILIFKLYFSFNLSNRHDTVQGKALHTCGYYWEKEL